MLPREEPTGASAGALDVVRARVDAALEAYLPALAGAGTPPRLLEAMRYALLGGGKRIRPFLVLEAARIAGGREADALPGACAIETIHAFSLVQDDLPCMDDELERRGRPTCHRVFGEAIALLAADALFAGAFELLSAAGDDPGIGPARALRAVRELARVAGAAGMAGGQASELVLAHAATTDELAIVHGLKTGSLFRASLRIGGILGGGDDDLVGRLDRVGVEMGIVYQLVDDLVDLRHLRGGELEAPNLARLLGQGEVARLVSLHAAAADAELARLGPSSDPVRALVGQMVAAGRTDAGA